MARREWRDDELEISHLKGSGPGGQNRNKRLTGVRVHHLPSGLVVTATDSRSQAQNLGAALDRLEAKLDALAYVPKPRRPTRRSKGSQERRLQSKSRRSGHKANRGRFRGED